MSDRLLFDLKIKRIEKFEFKLKFCLFKKNNPDTAHNWKETNVQHRLNFTKKGSSVVSRAGFE